MDTEVDNGAQVREPGADDKPKTPRDGSGKFLVGKEP